MTIVKSPALTSALEAIAMPGVLIDHRAIADDDVTNLFSQRADSFLKRRYLFACGFSRIVHG